MDDIYVDRPLLWPEMSEKQASLGPVDVTDELRQGVGHGAPTSTSGSPGCSSIICSIVRARLADDPTVVAPLLALPDRAGRRRDRRALHSGGHRGRVVRPELCRPIQEGPSCSE
jgi:hypothetical protein